MIAAKVDADNTEIADTDNIEDETSKGDSGTAVITVAVVIIILFIIHGVWKYGKKNSKPLIQMAGMPATSPSKPYVLITTPTYSGWTSPQAPSDSWERFFYSAGLTIEMRWLLRSKIHRATVTQTCLDYESSITVDQDLLDRARIWVIEKVTVVSVINGNRFDTYTISGERDSGVIAVNGAAARLCDEGDLIIIMEYELVDKLVKAHAILVDSSNRVSRELVY